MGGCAAAELPRAARFVCACVLGRSVVSTPLFVVLKKGDRKDESGFMPFSGPTQGCLVQNRLSCCIVARALQSIALVRS